MIKKILFFALILIATSTIISAQDFNHVLSNSEDWKDVYSTLLYANLQDIESDFITSTNHGNLILQDLKKDKNIRVITSKNSPYMFNYPNLIESKGFADVDEIIIKEANIELIDELKDIQNFIIIGDSYGYDAIAVTPYAKLTNSWVFLSNNLNIQEIDLILSERNINKIMVYGYVNKEIRDILDKYNPEIIDNQDRSKNNIEIVKKYLEIQPTKQILLTNGEFMEKELMGGKSPILFTGKENVPDQIRDYLKESEIEIGILIGNELIGAATNIRRSTGISVMVKFARGARTQNSGVSAVEGLDLFPVPTPLILLAIYSIKYNKVSSQLEITYKSESNIPIYFKGTTTINSESDRTKIGDTEPIFLAPENFKTIIYPIDLSSLENLNAEIYTLFGETKSSLDRVLESNTNIDLIDVLDSCEIDVKEVVYNKQNKEFKIKVKNLAEVDCWTSIELEDLIVGYTQKTIGSEISVKIPSGKTRTIKIKEKLDQEDLDKNLFVELTARHGEREEGLVNIFKGRFELGTETLSLLTYVILTLLTIIIILTILIILIKRREEDDSF